MTLRSSWRETCPPRRAHGARDQAAGGAIGGQQIDRMLKTRCADGRVRNMYKIDGAVTGRWSGEGFQPQNLKRPELLQTDEAIAEAIGMVLAGDYAAIKARYGDVLGVIGDLCRSMLIPAPAHRFIVGDFSAIEARVLAFLAGDTGKLETLPPIRSRHRPRHLLRYGRASSRPHRRAEQSPERAARARFSSSGWGTRWAADKLLATIRKANIPNTARITIDGDDALGAKMARRKIPRSSRTGPCSTPRRRPRCAIPD